MINRVILVLVLLTAGMQSFILYRQYSGLKAQPEKSFRDVSLSNTIDLLGHPTKGSKGSKVVLIEFSDFECPFCRRYAAGVSDDLDKKYVESGLIRISFFHSPLPIHSNARLLSTAAICAENDGQFWEARKVLFEQKPKSKDEIVTALD